MHSNADTEYAKSYFETVAPLGWSWDAAMHSKSGGGALCFVKNEHGQLGVFKCLKKGTEKKKKKRFWREISVLSDLSHPNIVKLLAKAGTWYITPRGEPLKSRWKSIVENCHPTVVERRALEFVIQLGNGIAECHTHGLVHRDIKPENIVLMKSNGTEVATLIDFGLVDEDREDESLTLEGEAIGNRACSHDFTRFVSDDAPPWVDVFSLMQVFQWMMASESLQGLTWARPLHWKYISYRNGVTDLFASALRAASAVCSIEETCPKNGTKFLTLIESLFGSRMTIDSTTSTEIFATLLEASSKGMQKRELARVTDIEAISAESTFAEFVLADLKSAIVAGLRIKFSNPGSLEVRVVDDKRIDSLFRLSEYEQIPFSFDSGQVSLDVRVLLRGSEHGVGLRLVIEPLRPSRSIRTLNDGTRINMFSCCLLRGGSSRTGCWFGHDGDDGPADFCYFGFDTSGNIWELGRSYASRPEAITTNQIVERCVSRLCVPSLWERAAEL
ncbi:MAG: protein kinase family protein [Planctomycetales bacterium]|nr:protein kinase family protein [Planctomycetales bacterium]